MHLASPIWLALLLPPWAALAAWLLWVRRAGGTGVPFLDLWRGPVTPARSVGRFEIPPVALLALIVAMLLGVIAAARPSLPKHEAPSAHVAATAPASSRSNVAITHVAAVDRPRAQLMVTVRNESSDRRSGTLEIRSGQAVLRRDIAIPPRGREANFFIDLSAPADRIEISLDAGDDVAADNRAVLQRKSASPRVEVRGDVPPAERRVIEAYARARPPGESGRVVACPPAEGEAGVIVAAMDGKDVNAPPRNDVRVAAHPVTANLDFTKIAMPAVSSPPPAGSGWSTLVSVAGKPVLMARESSARQVWIGFGSKDFAVTSAFVVLWTNAIDWVGETDASAFVQTLGAPSATVPAESAKPQAAEASAGAPDKRELAPILAFCALLCVFFATLGWSAGRPTPAA
jgi:hypothetical protein